ncbi:MAG TPA: SDR family NAD(P)-dependent oxidoreductase [Flavobacteriales bacterium]|nr:SDR family NAD(P)-dependent oxidoreductase [Flavobacteriales bacterium]
MQLTNNKILITGGGSGIGLALAERFAQLGNTIIVCGRRADALQEAAERIPGAITKVCDLSNEEQRIFLRDWVAAEHPDLNVLVNNAGIQQWMKVDDDNFYERTKAELAINIEAPVHLAHLFMVLPKLKTIMNVSSGLAFSPLAKTPVYSATKAFIRSFTLSLRHLLKDRDIEVIEVIPPALNTDLGGKGLHDQAPPVSAFLDAIFPQLEAGQDEVAFAFSEERLNAWPELYKTSFARLNP